MNTYGRKSLFFNARTLKVFTTIRWSPDIEAAPGQVGREVFGLTTDFSDIGVSLLVPQILDTDQVVCGFWQDEAVFALGKVARSMPFGGGFWHLGVALTRILDEHEFGALLTLVERLSPRASG